MKLNSDTVGFYRVSYTKEMREKLATGVGDRSLPLRDRMGLMNDMYIAVCFENISTLLDTCSAPTKT